MDAEARALRALALASEVLTLSDKDRIQLLCYLAGIRPEALREGLDYVTAQAAL